MKKFLFLLIVLTIGAGVHFSAQADRKGVTAMPNNPGLTDERPEHLPYATFAGGCFWCVESEFRPLAGVIYTRVGYIGGHIENPTYEQITTGQTGHAEAVEIYYDPAQISYEALLHHFLTRAHDPTEINRQGVDIGPQYRSAIFTHTDEQAEQAHKVIAALDAEGRFSKPIATEINPAPTFWPAETYHQQYYEKYEQTRGTPHIRVILKKQGR